MSSQPEFIPAHYRIWNADLAELTDAELSWHWSEYGEAEGRAAHLTAEQLDAISPQAFVPAHYRLLYPDVEMLSDAEVVVHYLNHGMAEGRTTVLTDDELEAIDPETFVAGDYLLRYPGVQVHTEADARRHFLEHGQSEGKTGARLAARDVELPELSGASSRPAVLLICHEATRTGVPLLTWNLVRQYSERFAVVILLLSGGPLVPAFEETGAAVVRAADGMPDSAADMDILLARIAGSYSPQFAISTSSVDYSCGGPLRRAGIPFVQTIHEFAPPPHSPKTVIDAVGECLEEAEAVVFSAEAVRSSYGALYGEPAVEDAVILRQGAYDRPITKVPADAVAARSKTSAAELASSGDKIVLAVGSINARKGAEFFVQTAARVRALGLSTGVKWVWLGAPDLGRVNDYVESIRFQVSASELEDEVLFLGDVSDVESYYALASCVYLPSRLDPLPNAAIDAFVRGVPVVTFDGAGGIAEVMGEDALARQLTVPYLDTAEAALRIVELLSNADVHQAQAHAARSLAGEFLSMTDYAAALEALATGAA